MGQTNLQELVASKGTFIVNTAVEKVAVIDVIVVLEDTVFGSIKVGGVDVKADYIGDSALSVKAGALIAPLTYKQFSAVTLVSGSVAIVLG